MEAPPPEFGLAGYLFNTCFGGFEFSEAFVERLNAQRASQGQPPIDYNYTHDRFRADPAVIALFLEMGSAASSGHYAKLSIKWFPKELMEYIDLEEYDGRESAWLDYNKIYANILTTFFTERITNPALTLDDLETRYKETRKILARYREYTSR